MASSMIHIAVANEINKRLGRDNNQLLIGAIAPDISKYLGENKVKSHFLNNVEDDIPNIDGFLKKYKNYLNDDFVMGYFIHLYTDYFWFKYFIPEFYEKDMITKMDGSQFKCVGKMLQLYIYNDYTNLNELLIDDYTLNLKIFYEDIPRFENIIDEIPMDKVNLIIDKISVIISNSKIKKSYVFDIKHIKTFISTCTDLILAKINEL